MRIPLSSRMGGVRRRGGGPGRRAGPGAAAVFWVALVLAVALSGVLLRLLAAPVWDDAGATDASYTLLRVLRVWAAAAWGVVIVAGLRLLRRR
jgi:hypothetical protein